MRLLPPGCPGRNGPERGLDSHTGNPPHRGMFGLSRSIFPVLLLAVGVTLSGAPSPVSASEPKPAAEPAPKPKPSKPSSLTGNAVPKCEAGTYAAGNICKPAAPGFYAPSGTVFPVACPEGMTSKSGSRSQSECYPEDGAPPAPPAPAKKGH